MNVNDVAFLAINNLSFKFDNERILSEVSFNGNKGDLIAIVGPSGCGKTTFLRIVVGILSPVTGQILVDQRDITEEPIERRKVGYVPQNQALFPHLTVFQNIAFGLQGQSQEETRKQVNTLAAQGNITKLLHRKPHELSGGERQRAALLRALAPSPNLLLLDEPLSNVDAHQRERLAIYIRQLQKQAQITTLYVTHDLFEAKMLADKLVILEKGRILQTGRVNTISQTPASLEVGKSIGLKNLFVIQKQTCDNHSNSVQLTTEIGEFTIPIDQFPTASRGLYVDPTQIQLSKEKIPSFFQSISGEILAVINEPEFKHTRILVQLHLSELGSMKPVIHVHIPLAEGNFFTPQEHVFLGLNNKSFTFYP